MNTEKKTRVKSPAAEAATAMDKIAGMKARESRVSDKLQELLAERVECLESMSPEAKKLYDKLTAE